MAVSGLRILIVNHCHPATPHVCATRAREFADALARRGNAVLLTTEARGDADTWESAAALESGIRRHDWSRPLVVACRPASGMRAAEARQGLCGPVFGPLAIALAYLRDGTVFTDWTAGARPYVGTMASSFRPDAVWAIFGNTGAWIVGREIAAAAGCPWVMDLKDGWVGFIPAGLRRVLASRFGDAALATAFSHAHAAEARRWFSLDATLVYSGISASFLDAAESEKSDAGAFRIVLTGGVYHPESLAVLVSGIKQWLTEAIDAEARADVRVDYYGADEAAVAIAISTLDGLCAAHIHGFRPLDELRQAHAAAGLNVYIKSRLGPFHHKVFELLSAGRPILCVPGEDDEANGIAARLGLSIDGAKTADDVRHALARAWTVRHRLSLPPPSGLAAYTWDAQAETLEAVLRRAAGKGA